MYQNLSRYIHLQQTKLDEDHDLTAKAEVSLVSHLAPVRGTWTFLQKWNCTRFLAGGWQVHHYCIANANTIPLPAPSFSFLNKFRRHWQIVASKAVSPRYQNVTTQAQPTTQGAFDASIIKLGLNVSAKFSQLASLHQRFASQARDPGPCARNVLLLHDYEQRVETRLLPRVVWRALHSLNDVVQCTTDVVMFTTAPQLMIDIVNNVIETLGAETKFSIAVVHYSQPSSKLREVHLTGIVADFLASHGGTYNFSLFASVDVIFQSDPFVDMKLDHLVLFASLEADMDVREAQLQVPLACYFNPWHRGISILHHLSGGDVHRHLLYLVHVASKLSDPARCSFHTQLQRIVWHHHILQHFYTDLFLSWEGPFISFRDQQLMRKEQHDLFISMHEGRMVVMGQDAPAAVVSDVSSLLDTSYSRLHPSITLMAWTKPGKRRNLEHYDPNLGGKRRVISNIEAHDANLSQTEIEQMVGQVEAEQPKKLKRAKTGKRSIGFLVEHDDDTD